MTEPKLFLMLLIVYLKPNQKVFEKILEEMKFITIQTKASIVEGQFLLFGNMGV